VAHAQDYYLFYLASQSPKSDLLKMWGEELNNEQVSNSFFTSVDFPVKFLDGAYIRGFHLVSL
jgi:hypothetical protein